MRKCRIVQMLKDWPGNTDIDTYETQRVSRPPVASERLALTVHALACAALPRRNRKVRARIGWHNESGV